jgi:psiF repeat
MRQLLTVLVAAMFAAVSVGAIAQDKGKPDAKKEMKTEKKAPTAAQKKRQERMKECNAQADEKKLQGDERKKFVSSCAKPAAKKSAKKTDKMDKK